MHHEEETKGMPALCLLPAHNDQMEFNVAGDHATGPTPTISRN